MDNIRDYLARNNCAQVAIRHRGNIVLDEQFNSEPQDVAAVQKGIVALMMGIAQEKFLLEIIDNMNHHVDPEWTNIGPWDEAKLTIEHLMTMTTGMDDKLNPAGKIGSTWFYNNIAYQKLKEILTLHTGLTLNEVTRQWICDPLNMTDTEWRERDMKLPDGSNMTGLYSTASDLVKVGDVVMADGAPLISNSMFMDQLAAPGSEANPAWGLMWWNNNQDRFRLPFREEKLFDGPIIPGAPEDLISARGARCVHLGVSKQHELVVAWTINNSGDFNPRIEKEVWPMILEAL